MSKLDRAYCIPGDYSSQTTDSYCRSWTPDGEPVSKRAKEEEPNLEGAESVVLNRIGAKHFRQVIKIR
jgi:hypothetical protein